MNKQSRTKLGNPIFKIQVPKFEFTKPKDDHAATVQSSPTSHKNGQTKKLSSVKSQKVISSTETLSTIRTSQDFRTLGLTSGRGTEGSPHSPNSPRTLFKTHTKPENIAVQLNTDDDNAYSGALKTKTGSALQPTKRLAFYDCWEDDLSPQQWVEECKNSDLRVHAKCPTYDNYKYVWVDVRVMDYDPARNKFLVQIIDTGVIKYVGRLSLLFFLEDPTKFRKRVEEARERQQTAEDEIRFLEYLDSLSDDAVSNLTTKSKKAILTKIKKAKREEEEYSQSLTSDLILQVEYLYKLHMKKFTVVSDMIDPDNYPKYKEQRIKIRERDTSVPFYNLFEKLDYPYKDYYQTAKEEHISNKRSWYNTIMMMARKSYQYSTFSAFAININAKDLPLELEDFNHRQKLQFNSSQNTVLNLWRDYLIGEIQDVLKNEYNFYSVGREQYFGQEFQKLMIKCDYLFNTYVRDYIVKSSVGKWLEFIQKFTYPGEHLKRDEIWRISEKPLLVLHIELKKKKERKKGEKEKDKKEKVKEDEEKPDESEGEMIYFSPSKEHILRSLKEPLEWLVSLVNEINKLEPDLVPFLYMPKCISYPLQVDDEIIVNALKMIDNYLNLGFEEPEQIIKKFRNYQFLFERGIKDTIKSFEKERPTAGRIRKELKQISDSMREIGKLCINEKNTLFFQVKTKNIKELIIEKANELTHTLLENTTKLCNTMVEEVNFGYEGLIEKLKHDPLDERELVTLKEEYENHNVRIGEFETQVKLIEEYIAILEDNNCTFKEKSEGSFWQLKVLPQEVREYAGEARRTAMIQEDKFRERLEDEKIKLIQDLAIFEEDFVKISKFNSFKDVSRLNQEVHGLKEKLEIAQNTVRSFNEREALFKIVQSDYETLNDLLVRFEPFSKMWDLCYDVDTDINGWYNEPFTNLKYPEIEKRIDTFSREAQKLNKLFQDNSDEALLVMKDLKAKMDEFRQQMPIIELLTKEAIKKKPQVWTEVWAHCNIEVKDFGGIEWTLKDLVAKNLLNFREGLEEISKKAEKQWSIEKKLSEMTDKIKNLEIEIVPHPKAGTYLIKTVEEIQQLLDDFLNIVSVLKASPYIKSILNKAQAIENRFILIQDCLENWMKCQRGWMYLEPIFSSDDIIKKLPNEHRKFEYIDKYFRNVMELVHKETKIFGDVSEVDLEKVNIEFDSHNKNLEVIQKALTDYLETKRKAFARFFFLSDEELLEILSQTKDPTRVQPHMSKCFEAINEVEFSPNQEVIAMISSEKEKVTFIRPVDVNEGDKKGNVEKWLLEVEGVMQKTLFHICKEAYKDVQTPRVDWLRKWPGQIVLAVNQVRWTMGAEQAINRMEDSDLEGYEKFLNKQLDEVVDLVRGELTPLERLTLGALVVIDVHARDTIHELVQKGVDSINDFDWIAQLRYYWEETSLKVKMINAELKYNFEYLGNSTRLVITPLTDRCYRTLLGAFYLQYGGAPEGPAGTGKTESVKDLAKAIAMMCVVFNCSDTLNYLAMRKFFKGLASSGGWCCFDEFNRIDLEVLSVIAQQVLQIQDAIRGKKRTFMFDGEDTALIATCAINITMNPGYAGRSELPDNLKALFRPCAMMVPNYSMISEIMLYSYGFKDARNLANKVVASLKLSSEQLSSQQHYDFGMRAVKAILTAAGQLKRTMMSADENIVCMRALYDVNLPKFTMNDIPLFVSITSDLFPGTKMPEIDYSLLQGALIHVLEEHKLIPEPAFLKKCIQLYETIMVRHGLMLVGSTFSGKSKVIDTLEKAMVHLKGQGGFTGAASFKLNPKSIKIEQLYGKFDPDSKAWSDGVLAILMRQCVRDVDNPERKWLLFDGPVDAVWIENMNTVLDDNKKLCLTSGEIIKMTNQMTMMFEVEDLLYASPATVSRCGMVYLETKNLGWEALLKAFIKRIPSVLEKLSSFIYSEFRWFLDACLAYAKKFGKYPMQISEMNMTHGAIVMMEIFLKEYNQEGNVKIPKDIEEILDNLILYSCVWAIGASFEEDCRQGFHQFIMKLLACNDVVEIFGIETNKTPFEPRAYKLKLNDPDNIYNITYDVTKGIWINWMQTIPKYQVPKEAQFHELIIPTIESLRTSNFFNLLVKNSKHILFTGLTGTGKTISILNELNLNYFNDDYSFLATCFSGQTQPNQVQRTIEGKMTTRKRKGVFGPEDRKKNMVIFIDDVNMPQKEKYAAQPPIELLRQWMDYGGWYDLETKEFKSLVDMVFVGAMGPPSAGRNSVTPRYMRHFFIQYVEPFSSFSLKSIFSNVLEWYFMNLKDPSKGIISLRDNIVNSTIELYNKIKVSKELLPTPAKSHYIYNLRDISKVFQGMTKATVKSFTDDVDFIKLWAHECLRVFQDRLISNEDRDFLLGLVKDMVRLNFRREWNSLVQVEPLLWASFVPTIYPDGDKSKRPLSNIYCELTDRDSMKKAADSSLEEYNNYSSSKMNLVLFTTAIEHVIKIVRVISTPFGHALLVGVGGSGRRSLATLAISIAGFDLFQIEIHKSYDQKAWAEDLQKVLKMTGLDVKPTVFLFTDTQIWKESILEDISSLLNNGEVPNLFPPDEKAKIIDEVSGIVSGTANQKYNYFVSKCKENLHMIICLSPVGEAFRRRLRTFPSLVNCTTIDWFLPWPEEALKSVAQSLLQATTLQENLKEGIIEICVDMQQRVRDLSVRYYQELRKYFYVTPTSYLELIATFKRLLSARNDKVNSLINRYNSGLEKLLSTEKEVFKMQEELIVLTPQLEKKSEEAQKMMVNIREETKIADAQREVCQKEEAECNIQKEAAEKLRAECKADLDKVLPILKEAEDALDQVDKNELSTLKSYQTVANPIQVTLRALCVLKSIQVIKKKEGMNTIEDWWGTAKKFLLNNVNALMEEVGSYDVKKISLIDPKIIAKLKEFFTLPDFEEKTVARASSSAASLCKWIKAVVQTYEAYLVVEPKQRQLNQAEEDLRQAEAILAEKKAQLQLVLDKIAGLEAEYQKTKTEKDTLEAKVDKCKTQIDRATKLTEGLKSEKESWKKRSIELQEEVKAVTGDVLLCSGIIAYLGAFPLAYREECQTAWTAMLEKYKIITTPNFKFSEILSDPITIGNWTNKYKLPNDNISVDNAIILNNSTRYPLMIDPQIQANRWIKELEKGHDKEKGSEKGKSKLLIIRPTQTASEYSTHLEMCISQGYPVLLENIDENIDPMFDSLISQKKIKQGGSWKIKFGDTDVDYSFDFRLYITTKLPKPHYPPEICVKVTLLNFTVTPEGLKDNMLNIVVKTEEPTMEEKRQNNMIEYFKNKDKQKFTEDNILQMLSEASGNILDNVELIETLKRSKFEAQEIENKLQEQARDQVKFQAIRNVYQGVASRVSALFFVVADLANIEPVYQYSLDWYVGLYLEAIKTAVPGKDNRCENIIDKFQSILYENVCRSLLEKDKLLFSFLVCMKIMQSENRLSISELRFFMVGGTNTDCTKPNPTDGWLTDKQWASFLELTTSFPQTFGSFDDNFIECVEAWKMVFNSADPIAEKWPMSWFEKLSPIQRLIVLRILRPDKIISGIQGLIIQEMGDRYIEGSGALDLAQVYKDSERSRTDPIIFILSPGVDPISEIMKLADKTGNRGNVIPLSLGQGMDKIALNSIDMGASDGRWVVLQNCHLAPSFMPALERKIEQLPAEPHNVFRLWLTTMPSDIFPVSILQNGIKLTNEPPKGLKNNLMRSYRGMDPKKFDECLKPAEYKKLVFGLCFFHAHVQERKKFGPLGWNIPYEFSAADLAISMSQLKIFLDQYPEIPYEALNYMVAEANYGGRVTDPMDRRLIKIILGDFYTPKILTEGYKFSESGIYYAPEDGTIDSYKDYIKELPYNDTAEVFGLHDNAEISSAINETNLLLGTALSLQPRVGGGSGQSSEKIIKEKCAFILQKLPKPFDLEAAAKKHPVMYEESMNTVLQQELLRFNRLLNVVISSLEQLGKAIEGLVVMSAELEEVFNKMFDNLVPELWQKAAYPSRKPLGSWINDLIERLHFMSKWIAEGAPPTFWISGFYFTQSFLTGTLQNYARKTQIAIDTLSFDFYPIQKENDPHCDLTKPPADGCYVYGLFLDGCRWDEKEMTLAEPLPKILNYKMCYLWLIPKRECDIDQAKHVYECPVYKTSRRAGTLSTTGHSTNFVLNMFLPMARAHDKNHWIKRGVALLTQLDD